MLKCLVPLTAVLLATQASAADYSAYLNRPYQLDPTELAYADQYAAASTAQQFCRADGVVVNRRYFADFSAGYAIRSAQREQAMRAAVAAARRQYIAKATVDNDGFCDDYIDGIEDNFAPYKTPIYWNDPLGQFNGPPSQSAVAVWDFFND